MKTLTIEQMETISGAKLSSACKEALASLGIGMLGVVFTAASVATGPIGWIAGGSIATSMFGASFAGAQAFMNCL